MIGWIIAGIIGAAATVCAAGNEVRNNYLKKLEKDKVGKTIVRAGKKSGEIYTFNSQRKAIEHPQEITFDPNKDAFNNLETVFLLNSKKTSIEVFDGTEFKTVSDSQLLTIKSEEGKDTYAYLRFVEKDICQYIQTYV